jgi:hypothetical protein
MHPLVARSLYYASAVVFLVFGFPWAFAPFGLGALIAHWTGSTGAGVVLGAAFGWWFYSSGAVMLPLELGKALDKTCR